LTALKESVPEERSSEGRACEPASRIICVQRFSPLSALSPTEAGVYYRLCVDLDPDGRVRGASWERHPDGSTVDRISVVSTGRVEDMDLSTALWRLWNDVVEAEGIVPFP
jgi:hypothetical protein